MLNATVRLPQFEPGWWVSELPPFKAGPPGTHPDMDQNVAREIVQENDYKDKLIKLIPSEVVAAFMAVNGMIPEGPDRRIILTVVTAFLWLMIPLYQVLLYKVRNSWQIAVTMGSFVVWVYSMGGPFLEWDGLYKDWLGSVLLVLWTLVTPLFAYSREA